LRGELVWPTAMHTQLTDEALYRGLLGWMIVRRTPRAEREISPVAPNLPAAEELAEPIPESRSEVLADVAPEAAAEVGAAG